MSTDSILASSFGVIFITAMLVLARKFPNPTPFQILVFRSVLALSAGGVAAFIPGFLQIQATTVSFAIRAGGALAVFLLVYKFNPGRLVPHNSLPGPHVTDGKGVAREFPLHINIRECDRPPATMHVTNIGTAAAVISTLSVLQSTGGGSVMSFPLSIPVPHEGTVTVDIQQQLNKFVWDLIARTRPEEGADDWYEQLVQLEVSLKVHSTGGDLDSPWLSLQALLKIHPTYGSRVDQIRRAGDKSEQS